MTEELVELLIRALRFYAHRDTYVELAADDGSGNGLAVGAWSRIKFDEGKTARDTLREVGLWGDEDEPEWYLNMRKRLFPESEGVMP